MSTPFDVDGLWQIRLTITSPNRPRFHTQGYIDESIKDKILATLSEKTQQSSDKCEACARVCDEQAQSDTLGQAEKYRAMFIADTIRARGKA